MLGGEAVAVFGERGIGRRRDLRGQQGLVVRGEAPTWPRTGPGLALGVSG